MGCGSSVPDNKVPDINEVRLNDIYAAGVASFPDSREGGAEFSQLGIYGATIAHKFLQDSIKQHQPDEENDDDMSTSVKETVEEQGESLNLPSESGSRKSLLSIESEKNLPSAEEDLKSILDVTQEESTQGEEMEKAVDTGSLESLKAPQEAVDNDGSSKNCETEENNNDSLDKEEPENDSNKNEEMLDNHQSEPQSTNNDIKPAETENQTTVEKVKDENLTLAEKTNEVL